MSLPPELWEKIFKKVFNINATFTQTLRLISRYFNEITINNSTINNKLTLFKYKLDCGTPIKQFQWACSVGNLKLSKFLLNYYQ